MIMSCIAHENFGLNCIQWLNDHYQVQHTCSCKQSMICAIFYWTSGIFVDNKYPYVIPTEPQNLGGGVGGLNPSKPSKCMSTPLIHFSYFSYYFMVLLYVVQVINWASLA